MYDYIVKDGPQSHRCTLCSKVGSDRSNLRKHIENIHFSGMFVYHCKYCSHTEKKKSELSYHEQYVHLKEDVPTCSICEKTFQRKGALKRHKQGHTDEKPFTCFQCDKRLRDRSSLTIHAKIHEDQSGSRFSCSECGKNFSRNRLLSLHMQSAHTKDA